MVQGGLAQDLLREIPDFAIQEYCREVISAFSVILIDFSLQKVKNGSPPPLEGFPFGLENKNPAPLEIKYCTSLWASRRGLALVVPN